LTVKIFPWTPQARTLHGFRRAPLLRAVNYLSPQQLANSAEALLLLCAPLALREPLLNAAVRLPREEEVEGVGVVEP
jgi:hypothetical protein